MLPLLLAALCAAPQSPTAADPALRGESLRLAITGPRGTVDALRGLGYDGHDLVWRRERGHEVAEIIAPHAELAALRRSLPRRALVAVLEESRPFREIVEERRRAGGIDNPPDPNYKTPAEVLTELRRLEAAYPGLAAVYDLQSRYGAPPTHGGRRIWVLRVSDHAHADEDEPNVLVFANNHARELNSIEVPLDVASRLLAGYATDPAMRRLVDDNQVWILPNMNPDGLDYVWTANNMWRKNRRDNGNGTWGVDLNRNYWYFWGQCGASTVTGSETYQGPAAGSEPETLAMRAFAQAEGFERLIDVHSYSRDVRHPFNPLVQSAVPTAVSSLYGPLHGAIASAMGYVTRGTCCCGTHMEWHHANHGTLAFLVEMGTSFQPSYSSTASEIVRMWPGLKRFLEEPVPLRGVVRSLAGAKPLAADVSVAGVTFRHGQRIAAVGRFARYQAWIAPGTYDVTFSAPGHQSSTVRVTLTAGSTATRDVWLAPSARPTTLAARGAPRIGAAVDLDVDSPDDAGRTYFLPVSLWPAPPIPAGGDRTIPIAASFLLDLELQAPSIFVNVLGTLDGAGRATGRFAIPNDARFAGLDFWFAALTFEPSYPFGIKGISDAVRLPVTL